jgi:hypothetical protein
MLKLVTPSPTEILPVAPRWVRSAHFRLWPSFGRWDCSARFRRWPIVRPVGLLGAFCRRPACMMRSPNSVIGFVSQKTTVVRSRWQGTSSDERVARNGFVLSRSAARAADRGFRSQDLRGPIGTAIGFVRRKLTTASQPSQWVRLAKTVQPSPNGKLRGFVWRILSHA